LMNIVLGGNLTVYCRFALSLALITIFQTEK
jgi:hypothetical protein